MADKDQRIEDLEEALRLIVCILQPNRHHTPSVHDWAVLAVACDQLGIDPPEDTQSINDLVLALTR